MTPGSTGPDAALPLPTSSTTALLPPAAPAQAVPCPRHARTGGTRARPRSGGQPWGGSRHGRCCGSGRRSGAGGGARRASWPGGPSWRGSSPQRHSTACAAAGPRCTPSPAPAAHAAAGRRRLGSRQWLRDGWTHRCSAQAGLSQPGECVSTPSAGTGRPHSPHHLQSPLPTASFPAAPGPAAPLPTVPMSAHSQSR